MFVWACDCVTKLQSDVVACCRTSLLGQPNSERRHNEGISPKPGRADSGHFLPARDFPWATLISSGSRRLWPWATCSTQFVNDDSTLYLFCGFFHNFVCLSSLKSSGCSPKFIGVTFDCTWRLATASHRLSRYSDRLITDQDVRFLTFHLMGISFELIHFGRLGQCRPF